jgi:hypothetical protein
MLRIGRTKGIVGAGSRYAEGGEEVDLEGDLDQEMVNRRSQIRSEGEGEPARGAEDVK